MCDRHRYAVQIDESYIGRPIILEEFPELKVTYLACRNSLYTGLYCAELQVYLSVTLEIDGSTIMLSDNDTKNQHRTMLGVYEFAGESVRIENQSEAETYLVFTVCRHSELGLSSSSVMSSTGEGETMVYILGEPFFIKFREIAGDGYTWGLRLPPEVEGITSTYAAYCGTTLGAGGDEAEQRPGCLNIHTFVLKGVKRGKVNIEATYTRHWATDKEEEEVERITKNYRVVIL